MSSDGKDGGFKVTDRRSFAGPAEASSEEPGAPPPAAPATPQEPLRSSPVTGMPPVDFHTFVLSLGSSALLHLGELESPDGDTRERDLGLAKHTIDILAMLREKTRGNLTPAEAKLIESLLYDLRLKYVEALK
jgi:hypothetical protein